MAYQSLYRRYRPQRFDQIVGQDHVVRALRNAAAEERTSHAYLFSGPRGTGKTSTARILAKVLNCENVTDGEPCGTCDPCRAVETGRSLDVTELDAASNRGIDDMRDLIGTTALASPGRTKLYILDEVHMLSKEASAALLKTLEEPPEHVVFVLATTDPQKVLPTIRSRTQHLELTLLPATALEEHVRWVVADAELEVDDDGINQAMRDGGGSARDTLSALDRIVAAGGTADSSASVDELINALARRDAPDALLAVAQAAEQGRDPRMVGEALLAALRDAFLVAMRSADDRLSEADQERARALSEELRPAGITRALEVLGAALVDMRQASDPRIPLDVAVVQICRPETDPSPTALLERIERLERAVRDGVTAAPAGESPSAVSSAATDVPAPAGDDASSAAPPVDSSSPVAAAREALAKVQAAQSSGAKPALGAVRAAQAGGAPEPAATPDPAATSEPAAAPDPEPAPTPDPAPETSAPAPPPEPNTPSAAPEPGPAASGSDLPSRDELTLAWGDGVLSSLRPKLKALFAAGRFVEVTDGVAVFALPNAAHCARCEENRSDVEAALAAHYGRPVPLRLIADEGTTGAEPSSASPGSNPTSTSSSGTTVTTPADDEAEIGDVHDLEDAPKQTSSGIETVTEVFGEVEEVVQEEPT